MTNTDLPPPPPSHLSDAAAKVWRSVVEYLAEMGPVPSTHLAEVERYARLTVQWQELMQDVEDNGVTFDTYAPGGQKTGVAPRPEVGLLVKIGEQLKGLERELALSPSSRKRVFSPSEEKRKPGRPPNSIKEKVDDHDLNQGPRLIKRGPRAV